MKKKIGVLVINLGSPDSPTTDSLKKYLTEFLMDPFVVDIPYIWRAILMKWIVIPRRASKSAEKYKLIWTEKGSPLVSNSVEMFTKLKESLGDKLSAELGMTYGDPSIKSALYALRNASVEKLLIIPLFPQYALSTTESVIAVVNSNLAKMGWDVGKDFLKGFYSHPQFISGFEVATKTILDNNNPEHVLISFHGLPQRHLTKIHDLKKYCLKVPDCCSRSDDHQNGLCYRSQCYKTGKLLAERLQLDESQYTISFQSRFGRDTWIKPYTRDVIKSLAARGIKNIVVICPSFVADCLETLEEIAITEKKAFLELGGNQLTLVPSLNASDIWIECLSDLIESNT